MIIEEYFQNIKCHNYRTKKQYPNQQEKNEDLLAKANLSK